jgi:hypothetical protein
MATIWWIGRRGDFSRQADELRLRVQARTRHGGQQGARVRVLRRTQHFIDRSLLDDTAQVHHRHGVRQMIDDGEVVGDEQVGEPEIGLQVGEQIENLRLHRNVERRGRLVADHQVGLHGQRAGNRDALPLPARELVRVTSGGRWIEAHLLQDGSDRRRALRPLRVGPASPARACPRR